jgi:hypothetical protein
MKNKTLMITLLLALLGSFLIVLSIFYLYQNGKSNDEQILQTKRELEAANEKLENLKNELDFKNAIEKDTINQIINSAQSNIKSNSLMGQNIPLVEITDLDISDDDRKNKKDNYVHQLRFYIYNIGKNSLKDVIVSIKDIYNDPKDIKKRSRVIGHHDGSGADVKSQEIGTYENFEINTLNLKSRRLIYASTLPNSFGVAQYTFHVIVEWKGGFYQMQVTIDEFEGNLKYKYEYYDVKGKLLDFETLERSISK